MVIFLETGSVLWNICGRLLLIWQIPNADQSIIRCCLCVRLSASRPMDHIFSCTTVKFLAQVPM